MHPRAKSVQANPWWVALVGLLFAILAETPSLAQAQVSEPVDFAREVQPIFARRCFKCHGPGTAEAELDLSNLKAAARLQESGDAVIVPGDPQRSILLARIQSHEERMPPEGRPLSGEEIDLLTRWIAQGAAGSEHWSHQPPRRVDVPDGTPGHDPIDAFLADRLRRAGIKPVGSADKVTLIRRVTYDLLGLPPTPEEIDDFLADSSPDAFAKLVDRLLASPHYGEKWARHWLDLVRYADTNGYERDGNKELIWKYRDYVIRSFNEDKPYDRFVLEQLAGDELPDRTADSVIATGYYRLGIWDDEPVDPELARYDYLDDILRTTGEAFLAMTVGCARCHDHKIDPITQRDYYAMLAFFANIAPHGKDRTNLVPLDGLVDESAERNPSKESGVLVSRLKDRRTKRAGRVEHAMAVAEDAVRETWILARGNPAGKGELVSPAFPQILNPPPADVPDGYASPTSAGQRRVLAEWLTHPQHPTTARVMVNRVWQHHFGRGIVRSSSDFGFQGTPPTHPELLDWLALEWIEHGWSLKWLHRRMLLTQAYQRSALGKPDALNRDPENDLFWRFNPRRLTAEELRDAILAINGSLTTQLYGPSVFPPLPQEVLQTASRPDHAWGKSTPEEANRRSIYIHVKRSLREPLLALLDAPDSDTPCAVRMTTTVPTQALTLLNSAFSQEQAGRFADRLRRERPDSPRDQVAHALRLTSGSMPSEEEIQRDLAWLEELVQKEGCDPSEAFRLYCLLLLNTNEMMYLD